MNNLTSEYHTCVNIYSLIPKKYPEGLHMWIKNKHVNEILNCKFRPDLIFVALRAAFYVSRRHFTAHEIKSKAFLNKKQKQFKIHSVSFRVWFQKLFLFKSFLFFFCGKDSILIIVLDSVKACKAQRNQMQLKRFIHQPFHLSPLRQIWTIKPDINQL